jgi:hypothetical protein
MHSIHLQLYVTPISARNFAPSENTLETIPLYLSRLTGDKFPCGKSCKKNLKFAPKIPLDN